MRAEALLVRAERAAIRRLPAGLVFLVNARIHRWRGEPELRELPRLVAPGSIAVDVGAHFGTYSHALARLVGTGGKVLGIEPVAEDARFLRAAARQLRLPIEVHNCALSSRSGMATLHIPDLHGRRKTALSSLDSHDPGGETREVPVTRLDDLLRTADRPVSFVKIDVEGHEAEVLRGASETIARHRPNLLIEIDTRFHDVPPSDVFAQILAYGYRGEFIDATGQRRPIAEFDPAIHQDLAHDVLSRHYISNFIFVPV